ncbi:hypothetical protein QTH97_12595 [Variovorax sp. J22R24]|uniref:hypothetical protein n=1 Tax=Variovorax gracilis TaxID=3053502 RepID=UPI002575BF7E|nr:hypothetical protein [Variovorax sp. J22R24]MDM0105778.1 hypothetical protein [Variovorax sp. J22R24]
MSQLRNIALTVQELEEGEFYWVLMEATDYDMEDALPYLPIEAASDPHRTYANALVAGVAAIRKMFGKDGPRTTEMRGP